MITVGAIVQLHVDPAMGLSKWLRGALMVVTAIKGRRLIGVVHGLGDGNAHINVSIEQVHYVGRARWAMPREWEQSDDRAEDQAA